jgi:aryl-alcohol dehydrogenase-like predicted oxidoreductase
MVTAHPPGRESALGSAERAARGGARIQASMIATRVLGHTGVPVSIIGLGGYHLGDVANEKAAVKLVHRAIDAGITFLDNCWDYHDGKSEKWMGAALREKKYRERAFVMTKVDGRTHDAAAKQIDQSLQRLGVDHIDLLQHHEVIRFEDADRIFADGGAMEAFVEAKQAGKIRFIGFTGHKDPQIHLRMLDIAEEHGFVFDSVQMPLNCFDAHFRSFEKQVLPLLLGKNIAALGMKPMGGGKLLESGKVSAEECLRYALSLGASVVITGIESEERLDQAIAVADNFLPLSATERDAILARTAELARSGKFESFKTTTDHDGTAQNVAWLG